MAFNVQDFKSRGLQFHGARPTLFEVEINNPPAGTQSNVARRLSFSAALRSFHQLSWKRFRSDTWVVRLRSQATVLS
jgi:hypothetical protein